MDHHTPDPTDPFGPPAIPTLVECLHCGEEYESYLIEWRVMRDADGTMNGRWCCPIKHCDGAGFGFDIFPLDPDYQDERGITAWANDDEDEEDWEEFEDTDWKADTSSDPIDDEDIPF